MTRPGFTVSIPEQLIENGVSKTVLDSMYCKEVIDGSGGPKGSGFLFPKPYYFERVRYERHSGVYSYSWSNGGPWVTNRDMRGCWGGSVPNSLNIFNETFMAGAFPSSLRDQALLKARLAMKNQSIDLGTAFAEYGQTARLVGDAASSIAKSFVSLKRGNVKGAMRALGLTGKAGSPRGASLTSKWLELQYGWMPLLSDVYGANHALATRDKGDWRVTGKGSTRENISVSKFVSVGPATANGWRGCFVRIDAVPENDLLQAFASLGITNPVNVLWEVVPFSFVVDWFLPVGNFLQGLDAMLGFGQTSCSISEFEKYSWSSVGEDANWTASGFNHRLVRQGQGKKEYVRLKRTTSSNVPLPVLPRLKDPLSLGHMANGLSLLTQAFLPGRR